MQYEYLRPHGIMIMKHSKEFLWMKAEDVLLFWYDLFTFTLVFLIISFFLSSMIVYSIPFPIKL